MSNFNINNTEIINKEDRLPTHVPLTLIPKPVPQRLQGMTVLFVVVDCEVYGGVLVADSGEVDVTAEETVGSEV